MERESVLTPLKERVSKLYSEPVACFWKSHALILVNLRLPNFALLSSTVCFRFPKEILWGHVFHVGMSYRPSSFPCNGNSNNVWRTEQFTNHLPVEFLEWYYSSSFLFSLFFSPTTSNSVFFYNYRQTYLLSWKIIILLIVSFSI